MIVPDESEERLREILHELRDHLEATDSIDAQLSVKLRGAVDDVERVLGPEAEGDAERPDRHHPLIERLKAMALDFEASHPKLANAINKLTNELASMGI